MDIDFYKGFDFYDSVSFNNELWGEILAIDYLDKVKGAEEIIPEGYDGAGETLERVHMDKNRNLFIKGLARLIVKYSGQPRDANNVEVLSTLLKTIEFINDDNVTHFRLDV
ncbi:hypothetical protein GIW26_22290 [Pseudomonas syringae]|uniref:hypothetical protein n=1 Tax=Pseudomonas syringae TaxID=317 RepID=UPI001F2E7E92|nr:hypothetical protein [Pseudomonas syringae]MCF8986287.1 hypothetical protein [Pseudomonas syringae]